MEQLSALPIFFQGNKPLAMIVFRNKTGCNQRIVSHVSSSFNLASEIYIQN